MTDSWPVSRPARAAIVVPPEAPGCTYLTHAPSYPPSSTAMRQMRSSRSDSSRARITISLQWLSIFSARWLRAISNSACLRSVMSVTMPAWRRRIAWPSRIWNPRTCTQRMSPSGRTMRYSSSRLGASPTSPANAPVTRSRSAGWMRSTHLAGLEYRKETGRPQMRSNAGLT